MSMYSIVHDRTQNLYIIYNSQHIQSNHWGYATNRFTGTIMISTWMFFGGWQGRSLQSLRYVSNFGGPRNGMVEDEALSTFVFVGSWFEYALVLFLYQYTTMTLKHTTSIYKYSNWIRPLKHHEQEPAKTNHWSISLSFLALRPHIPIQICCSTSHFDVFCLFLCNLGYEPTDRFWSFWWVLRHHFCLVQEIDNFTLPEECRWDPIKWWCWICTEVLYFHPVHGCNHLSRLM